MNVLPKPKTLKPTVIRYELKRGASYYFAPEFRTLESFAAKKFMDADFPITRGNENSALRVLFNDSAEYTEQSYSLTVDENGVTIKAKTPCGAFYGFITFLQISRMRFHAAGDIVLQGCTIFDSPKKEKRGVSVLSPLPIASMMKLIEQMAYFKLNELYIACDADEAYMRAATALAEKYFISVVHTAERGEKTCDFSHPYIKFRLKKLYLGNYTRALILSNEDDLVFDFYNFPRIQAFAESEWCEKHTLDYFDFECRLQQFSQEQDMDGIYHCKPHLFRTSYRYSRRNMKKKLAAAFQKNGKSVDELNALMADEVALNEYENLI